MGKDGTGQGWAGPARMYTSSTAPVCMRGWTGVDGILGFVPSLSKLRKSTGDDWIDRVSHLYSVILLVIFAIVVSTGQFVGDPIQCWCPAEFTDAYEAYTNSICWISNTYYIPMEDTIPSDIQARQDREITYYQWVPIILLFQAFLFKVPNVVWKLLHGGAGVDLSKVVKLAEETQCSSPEDRETAVNHLAIYLDKWLSTNQEYKHNFMVRARRNVNKICLNCLCDKRQGTYLIGLFLIVKILYLVNVVSQFFILNAFMATEYNLYGFEYLEMMASGRPMRESPRFPRVTLCDFQIRQLQNLQRWTVQCVLPVNLFNEKIFIFLWFWLVLVGFLAGFGLLKWLFYQIYRNNKVQYIKKMLKSNPEIRDNFSKTDKALCREFAENYLRNDGVFLLYMIAKNATDLVVTDLVYEMWNIFKKKVKHPRGENNFPNNANNIDDMEPMSVGEKEPLNYSH
ncbi:hypothetical protein FSP39_005901 [Pinctada imbricata]|uniref:Innexin n=1 Tax=Pinctada imbricata TaxID=66713 RepID=A0AA88XCT5_PINIB|nr:hypothetical protein FSP39_005901 [Pinctada imbricata]